MKKVKILSLAVVMAMAAMFVGCKNGDHPDTNVVVNSISASALPNSGATKSVTAENMQEVLNEVMTTDFEEDPLISTIMGLIPYSGNPEFNFAASISRAAEDAETSELVQYLPQNILKFVQDVEEDVISVKSLEPGKSVKIGASLKNAGAIKTLPQGLSASVDAASYSAEVKYTTNEEIDVSNATANLRASAAVNVAELLGTDSSIIKGANASVAAAGYGNMLSSKHTASLNAGVATSAGISFLLPSGVGGKIIADVKIIGSIYVNDEILEALDEELEIAEESGDYTYFDKYFTTFSVKVAAYTDAGEETYTILNAESISDLMEFVAGFVEE